jgi:hypothetical protein
MKEVYLTLLITLLLLLPSFSFSEGGRTLFEEFEKKDPGPNCNFSCDSMERTIKTLNTFTSRDACMKEAHDQAVQWLLDSNGERTVKQIQSGYLAENSKFYYVAYFCK